jgi:glycosyltransferase involved in cell wall biosynthesis
MAHGDKRSGNPAERAAARSATAGASGSRAILWFSNSPWAATGYGQQTAQVTTRLKEAGHKVAIASNYGLEGTVGDWHGIKHFSRGFDLYSNDVAPAHMMAWAHENPGHDPLLVTLFDTWVLKGRQWDMVDQVASWVPIDHTPAPPDVLAWCARENVYPIAMSQFGQKMLERADIECGYVPHAIDTKVFKPTWKMQTSNGEISGRVFMEIDEDRFVVGMNSANKGVVPNRKAFPEAFLAFAMFAQKHDDAVLYIHTESKGAMGGINLIDLAQACGIGDDQIVFVDQYAYRSVIPPEILASIYTNMDVLLQPSMGEGFGIPAIEAQACGTPVVVSDASAQPELIGEGWAVRGQPWFDVPQKSWLMAPSVPDIVEALELAYQRGRSRSDKAIEFAQQYDADKVFSEMWVPTLEAL